MPGVSGTLLHLSFLAQSVGTASLSVNNSLFPNSAGQEISVSALPGAVNITAVPEPASLGLLLAGLGLAAWRRCAVRES